MKSFDEKLADFARLMVKVGLNVLPGQEVILGSPVREADFANMLVKECYKAGAKYVHVNYVDERNTLARYEHGTDAAFDYAPEWFFKGVAEAMTNGAARLSIYSEDPELLKNQDSAKVAKVSQLTGKAARPVMELVGEFAINWSLLSVPNEAWAKLVFPGVPTEEAIAKLWEAIFSTCRIDEPDPVAAWTAHCNSLELRMEYLNKLNLDMLHFKGPGTDLRLGLVKDHVWVGGWGKAKNGVKCSPNVPTEEVFTMPDRNRVDGFVSSTRPLAARGQVIDGIRVEFKQGKIVEATAKQSEDILLGLLNTDEGARHLGEVALVPSSCAVAKTGLLFYNTLFDENAASHIALGQCYAENIKGYADMGEEQRLEAGCNSSNIHEDWMIGSSEIDVDGILQNGEVKPLMRAGEWVDSI